MGKHEAPLEQSEFVGRDAVAGQQAEAGVDAVDDAAFGDDPCHGVGGRVDLGVALRRECQFDRLAPDAAEVLEGEFAGGKSEFHFVRPFESTASVPHSTARSTKWRGGTRLRCVGVQLFCSCLFQFCNNSLLLARAGCPIDRGSAAIVSCVYVRSGFDQEPYALRVSVTDSPVQSRLARRIASRRVSTVLQKGVH